MKHLVGVLLLCLAILPCQAQEPAQTELMLKNCKAAYDALQTENNALRSKAYTAQLGYFEYFYGDYARKRAEIQLGTFMWQARASEILIWVVVVVCLSGVLFSGYQLWRATAPAPVPPPAPGGGEAGTADAAHVRITSSVIGLVVLVISVAYLYLFLKEVYAIKIAGELDASAQSAPATPGPAKESAPSPKEE